MLISDHDCICPGYKLTLECSVNGTPFGTTVWHGDFFDCSDGIILLHNQHRFTAEGQERSCNGGAITGKGSEINGSCYTSQLGFVMNNSINGGRVECLYNLEDEILAGSLIINTTGTYT